MCLPAHTWELRANLAAYGAAYVALAEARRLAAAPGTRAMIRLL